MSDAFYNENDPFPAAWLRNLIQARHLPAGIVDERSIHDVKPQDCQETSHFFAGVGGWPLALKQAGWPDNEPVWTGSCPCQPFSVAGKRGGTDDQRHLWPEWFRLIRERNPGTIFGEQVASRGGLAWLDIVQSDLEGEGYTVGALDLCAAGFGAPHIRQRLYFVAHAERGAAERHRFSLAEAQGRDEGTTREWQRLRYDAGDGKLADASGGEVGPARQPRERAAVGELDDAEDTHGRLASSGSSAQVGGPGPTNGFWAGAEWLPCSDGKARPTQPLISPMAHGVPGRMGRLRAYGNAVVVPQAAEFVRAYMAERGSQG